MNEFEKWQEGLDDQEKLEVCAAWNSLCGANFIYHLDKHILLIKLKVGLFVLSLKR